MRFGVKIAVAFVVGLLIIGVVGIQSYVGIQRVTEKNRWVMHTHEVLEDLEKVLSILQDAETNERGYILTGEDSYLAPYDAATGEIQKNIDLVAALTANEPQQQASIGQLRALANDKLDELRETIAQRKQGGLEAALPIIRSDRGKRDMDQIRAIIDQMVARERELLAAQESAAGAVTQQGTQMVGLGALLSLGILAGAGVIVIRTMRMAEGSQSFESKGGRWWRFALRYGSAVVVVALATAARWWLERHIGPMPLFVTWYPAVLLVATIAGGGPGVLAALLSVLVADYWFIEPLGFGIANENDAVAAGIFTGTSVFVSILAERLRRARYAEAVAATQERELALLNLGNLMVLDLDHRIVRWSEGNRRLYGFESREALGQVAQQRLQTRFPRLVEEIHRELLAKGHWQGEVTQLRKDGTRVVVALLWALRRDERGRPQAILEMGTDITAQKAAEEALRQQSEELAQQNEELSRQSEELTHQSEELSEQNEELQSQSEEIQTLNADLSHRERTLQTLLDSARLSLTEQDVLARISQAAMEMIGPAAVGATVCEQDGDTWRVLAYAGFPGGQVPASWPREGSFSEVVVRENRTASLEDTALRPDVNLLPVGGYARFAAALASPVRVNDKCIGVVNILSDKPQRWTVEQFGLIEWLAGQCSRALEAVRLAEEIRHIQNQNEFLAGIVKASSQAFGVGYPDGRLGMVNPAFERLTGYSGEELRAIDWARALTPPEWAEVERRELEELHRTGLPVRYEKEYIRKDGTRVPIELLVHQVSDAQGKPLYYYSFITDITERKIAEENSQRLAAIVHSTDDAILSKSLDGTILSWNSGAERLFGYLAREVVGCSIFLLIPPEGRAEEDSILQRLARGEQVERLETVRLTKDGRRIDVLITSSPVKDAQGRVIGAAKIMHDITDRKRIEQALAESRQRLDLALRSARMATFDWDIVRNKRTWSDDVHRLLGTTPETFDGTAEEFFQIIHPDDRATVQAALVKAQKGRAPYETEYRAIWPDGTIHHIAARGTVHRDSAGRPVRMTGLCWDITESKWAQMESAAAAEFLKMIHDAPDTRELVRSAVTFFQRQSGCEAVGIRLKAGEDYPYYETRGFPPEFVLAENSLCARDDQGNIERDNVGNPCIACMCGNVIRGRFDPSKPFFSPQGSFWTNSTTQLLAGTTDADRQARTRNRCNGQGYESVALIPIGGSAGRVGLVQLNDKRPGRFNAPTIALWERLANHLAVALAKLRAEEALRESEGRYRTLFESLQEGFYLGEVLFNADGKPCDFIYHDVNPAFERIMGLPRDQIVGRRAKDLIPGLKPGWAEVFGRVQTSGQPARYDSYSDQFQKHFEAFVFQPSAGRFAVLVSDITERKRAEEELRLSEEKFALAFAGNPAAIALTRLEDGLFLDVNDTWLTLNQCTREEAVGHSSRTMHIWPSADAAKRFVDELKEKGSVHGWEQEFHKQTGEAFVAQLSAQVLTVRGEQVILSTLVDITARKRAEEALQQTVAELQRSNKELEQFAYISAHDLQEPLRQVRAYVGLLKDRYADRFDGKAGQYFDFVHDGAARMSDLVQGLLEYSRAGNKDAQRQPVDCQQVLNIALANLATAITESQAQITHDELPTVTAEPTQLTQLFQNLLGNAIKFGREGIPPQMHVGCRRQGDHWIFSVKDNGIGIDPQYQDKVFLIFQRLHGRDKYAGTGIGLAICKKIVEQHGGKIWVESAAGEGSTFYFTLPEGNN